MSLSIVKESATFIRVHQRYLIYSHALVFDLLFLFVEPGNGMRFIEGEDLPFRLIHESIGSLLQLHLRH